MHGRSVEGLARGRCSLRCEQQRHKSERDKEEEPPRPLNPDPRRSCGHLRTLDRFNLNSFAPPRGQQRRAVEPSIPFVRRALCR